MAKMIPSRIDEGAPSSERRVFDLLRKDPDTNGWVALHSLGLARRGEGLPYGEIDFVVMVPGKGIVCLEVKGGDVSCQDGVWRTRNHRGETNRLAKSPFMQARDASIALRKSIRDNFGNAPESECPVGYSVVFPDVACPPITPEFERCEVIDHHDLRVSISRSIMRYMREGIPKFPNAETKGRQLTSARVKRIREFLRPDFDRIVAKSVRMGRSEENLISLTEEQYVRLDEMEDNPRCLFRGAAGTGKTMLAAEFARRAANDGAKTLLVCYNYLLARWFQDETEGTSVTAGTWYEVARGFILESSLAEDFLEEEGAAFARGSSNGEVSKLFDERYPLYIGLALDEYMDENRSSPFDMLVIDEAQDIIASRDKLDFLDRVVQGGLASGRWAVFGDFTPRQALFGAPTDPAKILEEYSEHFTRANLTLNCRNTRRIAEMTASVAGIEDARLRKGRETGDPVKCRYWRNPAALARSLTDAVEGLVRDGAAVEDIVVLAPRRLQNTALAGVERIAGFPLVDITDRNAPDTSGAVKFSTIQAFKGLESPIAIVVAEMNQKDEDWMRSILYVGMSRAQTELILLVNERVRDWFEPRVETAQRRDS